MMPMVNFPFRDLALLVTTMGALCTVAAFLGAWLGRHFKELHLVTGTRSDLDKHLEWAATKEEQFEKQMDLIQQQSTANAIQLAVLTKAVEKINENVQRTDANVNRLNGVIETIFKLRNKGLGSDN
jgi:uncharacterized protein YukE